MKLKPLASESEGESNLKRKYPFPDFLRNTDLLGSVDIPDAGSGFIVARVFRRGAFSGNSQGNPRPDRVGTSYNSGATGQTKTSTKLRMSTEPTCFITTRLHVSKPILIFPTDMPCGGSALWFLRGPRRFREGRPEGRLRSRIGRRYDPGCAQCHPCHPYSQWPRRWQATTRTR